MGGQKEGSAVSPGRGQERAMAGKAGSTRPGVEEVEVAHVSGEAAREQPERRSCRRRYEQAPELYGVG